MVMLFVVLFVLFVRFLTRDRTHRTYILEVLQIEPPRLAECHVLAISY